MEQKEPEEPTPNQSGPTWISESIGDGVALAIRTGSCRAAVQSPVQQIEVHEGASALGDLYRLDGVAMAAMGDEFIYHENLVFPAALAHGAPRRVLVLGGGDGGSVRRLLRIPTVTDVQVVEIDPLVVQITRTQLPAIQAASLDDPRVSVTPMDAAGYFRTRADPGLFDLILFDLTDPGGAAQPLYERPFLQDCRAHLSDGGLLALHTASPFYSLARVRALLVELAQDFAVVRPYFFPAPLYGGWWGMVTAAPWSDPATLTSATVDHRLAKWGLLDLDYYNGEVHVAQFAQPNFLRRAIALPE
ncbi:MAG: polyamine aminopropyltransferase [Zoogloeaceae bacterium]|nr:polyamine aminopropyltransferase [Zoogloeaceae bacterium]